MVRDLIKRNLLKPLLERTGIALVAVFVGWGIQQDVAGQIAVGITAVAGVSADLVIKWVHDWWKVRFP